MNPGAVVVGAHVNGLGVVRALAPMQVPIAVVSSRPFDIAHHSRWVAERRVLADFHEQRDSLLELLDHEASRWAGRVVFPTNDDALTVLARHHESLSRSYRLPFPPWETTRHVVDKDAMHALAERTGLDLPRCHGPACAETARTVTRFPVIVKPVQHDRLLSRFGTKLFLARTPGELGDAVAALEAAGLPGLVFDFIPGPDRDIYVYCVYVDSRGEPSPGVTVRKIRQTPPSIGGARVAEVVPEVPGLREATVALLRAASFRGLAFAEFKLDRSTGRYVFMEVNARPVLFNGVLPPTGIDLVALAFRDIARGERTPPAPTGWTGAWVHVPADVAATLRHGDGRPSFREFVAPYRGRVRFAVWSASDPKPSLMQAALGLRRALARPRLTPPAVLAAGAIPPL